MQKILVTGGAGYIGSHTIVELLSAGYEPVIIDNYSNSDKIVLEKLQKITGQKIIAYEADCSDVKALRKIFSEQNISGVIHFAAFKAVGESVEKPLKYYDNNLISLIRLLEVMNEFKVNNFVFSSSCTVYGQPDNLPVSEDAPVQQANSPYGYTKQVSEQIIMDVINSGSEINAVLLRYFNPIGAHPSALIGELPLGVPNNLVPFITQTAAGLRKELTVFGDDYQTPDGTCIRDYIHVSDLANAHVKAFEWIDNNGKSLGIFNIGTGQGASVLEVIQSFEKESGKKLNYKIGPRRPGDVEQIWANADKSNKELGWKAKYTLDNAMLHAWKWQLAIDN
ncbi:MAG TPA: UDP-glucose 4-epimerase GalE [Bacteroidetes bacterium]|nr:UDP-glucose 4-epimerase GalE [Bacteroidota bacterium]